MADFEKNWQANSGADFILKNAPKELGISKVGFYKKFTPRPALDYVLRAEITGITDGNLQPAEEFLKKLREFKYPGCVTASDNALYKTDAEYIMYPEGQETTSGRSFLDPRIRNYGSISFILCITLHRLERLCR